MQVPEAHIVEGGRYVLLVTRVRWDQEERAIVETVALVPHSGRGVYIW